MFTPLWHLLIQLIGLALTIVFAVFDNEWDWDTWNGK